MCSCQNEVQHTAASDAQCDFNRTVVIPAETHQLAKVIILSSIAPCIIHSNSCKEQALGIDFSITSTLIS